jgi:hypothetical protein
LFLFVHLALEISPEEEVLRLETLVPMNIEVLTKYHLSHNDRIIFENCLHSENQMLYRPALHVNWNAVSLARRALRDKFPMPTVSLTAVLPNCQVFLPDSVDIVIGGGVSDMHLTHLSADHLTKCISLYVSVYLEWNYDYWSIGDKLQVEWSVLSDWW